MPKAKTQPSPVIRDVLARVAKTAEKQVAKRGVNEHVGTHAVDLTIQVTGAVTIASGTAEGEPVERCNFTRDQLLAALLDDAAPDPADRRRLIGRVLTQADRKSGDAAQVKADLAQFDAEVNKQASKRGLTTTKPKSPAKVGACGGSPGILIKGTIGGRDQLIQVEG